MKRSSENMQQIYKRALTQKCYFNKVASFTSLLHIFKTTFLKEHIKVTASGLGKIKTSQDH